MNHIVRPTAAAAGMLLLFAAVCARGQITETAGVVLFQAENYTGNASPGTSGYSWTSGNSLPGYSGTGYMQATPASGADISPAEMGTSPELTYTVNVTGTGVYNIWLHAYALTGTTAYVGLDEGQQTQMGVSGTGAFLWTNLAAATGAPATITVTSTGTHTISIWIGSPGISIDEAILTLNPNYTPNVTQAYWQSQSIYQIVMDRFYDGDTTNDNADGNYNPFSVSAVHGGDFKGFEEKLDYIKALGATAIWISPIVKNFFGNYHGYAGSDFYNVDPHWGALADIQHAVQEAHRRGLLVIDDIVCNHGSTLLGTTQSGYSTTFLYPPNGYTLKYLNPNNVYSYPFDPGSDPNLEDLFHNNGYIQNFSDMTQVVYGSLRGLDDFNTEMPYIRNSMIAIYEYWLSAVGFDAFRIDTTKHVDQGFWQTWCPALHSYAASIGYPNFFMFGEVEDGSDQLCGSYTGTEDGGPYEDDSVEDYPLFFMVDSVFANASGNTQQIENRYNNLPTYYAPESQNRLVTFLDNQDQPHFLSAGNANGNVARLDVALAFLYTARGIPSLYYGTEQGFNNGAAPTNREDMFAGEYQDNGTYGVDYFNEAAPIFQTVTQFNNFRRLYPALLTGTHVNKWNNPSGPGLFAYARTLGTQEVYVILNTAGSAQTIPVRSSIYPNGTVVENLLSPQETYTITSGSYPAITLQATTAKMFIAQSQVLPLDPIITSLSPAHDASGVPTTTPYVITFSKSMNTSSVQAAFSTSPATTGSFAWSTTNTANDTLTYTPTGGWATQTLYGVHIGATAADAVTGNTLHAPFDARFTVGTSASQSEPPSVTTLGATNTLPNSATLNANVNPNYGPTTYYFQYGFSTAYGLTSSPQSAGSGGIVAVSASVGALVSGSTYHYRVVAANSNGTIYGNDMSFLTPLSGTPAAVNVGPAIAVTENTAVLTGTVVPNGNATGAYFSYGDAAVGESETPWVTTTVVALGSGSNGVLVTGTLTGLSPDTLYYYTLTATNALEPSPGSTLTFTTNPSILDVVTSGASDVTGTSATLNGAITPNGIPAGGWVEFGPTTAYGSTTQQTGSDNAESYTSWTYGSNGGIGFGPATYLSGNGGGLYLAQAAGVVIDGSNSFGVYSSTGTQALDRAITGTGDNGLLTFSARFDVSQTVGFTGFNLKAAQGNSFSSGELISFGLSPSTNNSMVYIKGSSVQTMSLGSDIHGQIVDFSLNYDSPTGTYTLGAKFRSNPTYITVSGTLEETGTDAAYFGIDNENSGSQQNLVFDDLVSQTQDSFGQSSTPQPVSYDLTGLTPGTTYHFRIGGINSQGVVYGPDATFTTFLPIDFWRQTYFNTTDPNDPTAGDLAIPMGDGVTNLMKYALGMNPLVTANQGMMPAGGQEANHLTITFSRQQADSDITYHVDACSDLVSWTEIWTSANSPYVGNAPSQNVTVEDSVQMGTGTKSRFLRLRITRP